MKSKLIALILSSLLLIAVIACAPAASTANTEINSSADIESFTTLPSGEQPSTATNTTPAAEEEAPAVPSIVKIATIMESATGYSGKDVILEGKIVNECGAGCWFNLQDDTGIIYVDLAPNNLYIPQKVGSKARVYGVVAERNGVVYIIGNKVEF